MTCYKCRQRESTSKTAAEADVDDEFDDEETFLNLDDVLEGQSRSAGALPCLQTVTGPTQPHVTASAPHNLLSVACHLQLP